MNTCTWNNCSRKLYVKGFCHTHYKRQLYGKNMDAPCKETRECSVIDCKVLVYTSKLEALCKRHKHREGTGNISPVKIDFYKNRLCDYEGCSTTARSKGLCPAHYRQLLTKGILTDKKVPKGKYTNDQGYVLIYKPGQSDTKSGWMMEHRFVMENHLGRKLLPEETVHHKHGNRSDNRIENLELWTGNHQPGVRVEDICDWAEAMLSLYRPEKLISY